MENELQKGWRIRVNISRSVKGIVTPEFTVEGINQEDKAILEKIDQWDKTLKERYPIQVEIK